MNRYDKMTNSIRNTWKTFGIMLGVLTMMIASFTIIYVMKANMYEQEFESTTWYKTTASYTRSNEYTERDEDGDDVTKYTNFYQYMAKDGSTHEYADINCSSKGVKGETVEVYVDEQDETHALEVWNDKIYDKMRTIMFWICVPVIAFFSVELIIKYIMRAIAKAVMNR